MADFINTEAAAQAGVAILETLKMVTLFIVVAIIIGGILFFILRLIKFKHRVVIRDLVNGRVIVRIVKAREFTDKKGVNHWRLKGIRNPEERLMDVPDSRCIDTDEKGSKWVEVYRLPTGGYIPIYDKANIGTIPEDVDSIATKSLLTEKALIIEENKEGLERDQLIYDWKQKVIQNWVTENDFDKAFSPFSTQDRQAIVNNIKDAQERKHKSLLENLPSIVAIGGLVMMVICLLIFAPDWFEAKTNLNSQQVVVAQTLKEISLIQKDIQLGIQTIQEDNGEQAVQIAQLEQKTGIIIPD